MDVFRNRREQLINNIHEIKDNDLIILFSGFESSRTSFRPSSCAYYLTGIEDSGVVITIAKSGRMQAFVPRYGVDRGLWCGSRAVDDAWWKQAGFDSVNYLGEKISGYSLGMPIKEQSVSNLLDSLKKTVSQGGQLLTLGSLHKNIGNEQYIFMSQLAMLDSKISESFFDISETICEMRRIKDECEKEALKRAVEITVAGQHAAACAIKPGLAECAVRGAIERGFLLHGALRCSFPSIVATGKNATTLHHTSGQKVLENGDLVIVDVGAEYGFYAGDLTRTYPVSGKFSDRQKELYSAVLEAQKAAEKAAKPGMFLKNAKESAKSLHHIALKSLSTAGLEKFFLHGVGHYIGLEVHDVGDILQPLEPGCTFTIEPGVYIPDEGIGIRIEDNYLMTENGAIRLSSGLPREIGDIENIIAS